MMNVGELKLDDGRKICVFSFEEPKPTYPAMSGKVNLLKQNKEDFLAKKDDLAVNGGTYADVYGVLVRTTVESVMQGGTIGGSKGAAKF